MEFINSEHIVYWKYFRGRIKGKYVKASAVIEMSYIMPLFLSLFLLIMYTVFYYHDKTVITERRQRQLFWEHSWREEKEQQIMIWKKYSEKEQREN